VLAVATCMVGLLHLDGARLLGLRAPLEPLSTSLGDVESRRGRTPLSLSTRRRLDERSSPLELLLRVHPLLAAPAKCPRVAPVFRPVPVRSISHDTASFLQGLVFHDHVLYEAAGLYGKSSLRVVHALNGSVLRRNDLRGAEPSIFGAALSRPAARYFAEGITYWRGKLLMLTWKSGSLLEFDAFTLTLVREHTHFADQLDRREGWGITNDDNWLYVTDGSHKLYKVDPESLRVVEKIPIVGTRPLSTRLARSRPGAPTELTRLNELELLPNGLLLFNIWLSDYVGVYDLRKRCLAGWINGTGLDASFSKLRRRGACLNGIAFDETTGELLISGKLWPVMHAIWLEPQQAADSWPG